MSLELQQALASTKTYYELEPIVKDAQEEISFFGRRYIYSPMYKGSVNIDALADKLIEITEKMNYFFNNEERYLGKNIAGRITEIYQSNDHRYCYLNFITKFFCAVRDIIISLPDHLYSATRDTWDGWMKFEYDWERLREGGGFASCFQLYTPEQFKEHFGYEPRPGLGRTFLGGEKIDIDEYSREDELRARKQLREETGLSHFCIPLEPPTKKTDSLESATGT